MNTIKKKNTRKCKNCGNVFEKKAALQKYCMVSRACIEACLLEVNSPKAKAKRWKKEKKEMKAGLKTTSDWIREAQKVFNAWIRLRDKGNACISCGKNTGAKMNAGHFRGVGACPSLRFTEINCHIQCEKCNSFLSGNLLEYRKGLIKKIGIWSVHFLEGEHEPKHYTIPELMELKEYYKQKIKEA